MAEKTDRTPFQIAVPRLSNVEAYVDSSAFIAFFDKSDTWHARFAGLFARAKGLATTTLVIAETHGWFLRRFDSYRALEFMAFLESLNILQVVAADADLISAATGILRKYSDQSLTLADACGLYLLKKNPRWKNWSTDRHLELTGRKLIIR
jgi:predicted nucleic acid-binding protein